MQLFCWKFLVIELRKNKSLIKILVIYTYNAGKWDISFITNEKSKLYWDSGIQFLIGKNSIMRNERVNADAHIN